MVPSPWRIQDTYGKTKKIRFLVRHSRHYQDSILGNVIKELFEPDKVIIMNFMFKLYLNSLIELIILNVQCITYGDLVFVES